MTKLVAEERVGQAVVRVLQGDITLAETDAIVNAANSWLKHGAGVAGAIVRRGGRVIQEESDTVGFVPEGQVAVTGAGELPARYIIHAVGPRGGDPEADGKLQSVVQHALLAAAELGLESISFPAISTGIFGFPKDRCAQILITTVRHYLQENSDSALNQVDVVLFDDETAGIFQRALRALTTTPRGANTGA